MQLNEYVKPELLMVSVVLYIAGRVIKQSEMIDNKFIPIVNVAVGILICGIYVFSTCSCHNRQEMAMALFTAITQGILVAGISIWPHITSKDDEKGG